MAVKQTLNVILKRFKEAHGDFYDYSNVKYINSNTKVDIICRIHGLFRQTPYLHLKGGACPTCSKINAANKRRLTTSEFITKAKQVHNDVYDYSKVAYKRWDINISVVCIKHGEFNIRPNNHLNGQGCPKCGIESMVQKQSLTTSEFITKAKQVHNDVYNYSKVDYYNSTTNVDIICPVHGVFTQKPKHHLNGHGCVQCNGGGFDKQKPSIFYIHEVYKHESLVGYKFGITNVSEIARLAAQQRLSGFSINLKPLVSYKGSGHDVFNFELNIKQRYKTRYMSKYDLPDGWTETISIDDSNNLINVCDEYFKERNEYRTND